MCKSFGNALAVFTTIYINNSCSLGIHFVSSKQYFFRVYTNIVRTIFWLVCNPKRTGTNQDIRYQCTYVTLLYQFQREIQNIIRTQSFVGLLPVSFICCFFLVNPHHEKARYIFVFLLLLDRNYVARFTLGKIAVPGIRKKTPRYYKPWPNCGKIK